MDCSPWPEKVPEIFNRYHVDGLWTHACGAVGTLREAGPAYVYRVEPEGRDLYDLASLTKALVTTPLVFRLIRRGELSLETPVREWLAGAGAGAGAEDLEPKVAALSVRALLRHESGLPPWRNVWLGQLGTTVDGHMSRTELLSQAVNRAAASLKPASGSVYSDVGFFLLGLALERSQGASLATLFEDFCAEELGMKPSALPLHYGPCLDPTVLRKRAVPTGRCQIRGRDLQGEVHDENAAALAGIAPHAGLFGTVDAVWSYLGALYSSPTGRLLREQNKAQIVVRTEGEPNAALLGFRQGADPSAAGFRGGATMGHLGFTGVAFWTEPDSLDTAVLLSNRVIAGRMRSGIKDFRREFFTACNEVFPGSISPGNT